jgi:hypothetical protein
MQCFNTHGSDLHIYFREVFHGKCGRKGMNAPECEVVKFCVSWKI